MLQPRVWETQILKILIIQNKSTSSPFGLCFPFHYYLRSSKSAFKIFPLPAANLKQGHKVTSSLPSLPVFLSLLFFLAEYHPTSCSSSNSLTSLHPHTKQNTLPPLDYFVHLHMATSSTLFTQEFKTKPWRSFWAGGSQT